MCEFSENKTCTGNIESHEVVRTGHRRIPVQKQFDNANHRLGTNFVQQCRIWLLRHVPQMVSTGLNSVIFKGVRYEMQNAHAVAQFPGMRAMHHINAFLNDDLLSTYFQPRLMQNFTEVMTSQGIPLQSQTEEFQRLFGSTLPQVLEALKENRGVKPATTEYKLYQDHVTSIEQYLAKPENGVKTGAEKFHEHAKKTITERMKIWNQDKPIDSQKDEQGDIEMTEEKTTSEDQTRKEETILSLTKEQWDKANQENLDNAVFFEGRKMNFLQYCQRYSTESLRMGATLHHQLVRQLEYQQTFRNLADLVQKIPGYKHVREMDTQSPITAAAQAKMKKIKWDMPPKLCTTTIDCHHFEKCRSTFLKYGVLDEWQVCHRYHVAKQMAGEFDLQKDGKSVHQLLNSLFRVSIEPLCAAALTTMKDMPKGQILGLFQGDICTVEEQAIINNRRKLDGIMNPHSLRFLCNDEVSMDLTTSSVSSDSIIKIFKNQNMYRVCCNYVGRNVIKRKQMWQQSIYAFTVNKLSPKWR